MEVFSEPVFDHCLTKHFKTIVIFTKPEITLPVTPPEIEKYTGYLWSNGKEGRVTVLI